MRARDAAFLKYVNERNEIEGCVYLQRKKNRLYLGMLGVLPDLQARGTGKQLMEAAADYAKKLGCETIFMKVISVRHELIEWYERQGYRKTGDFEPFPADHRFGTPAQPLEFIILERNIGK
jgi:ribosomal protein S18 acetylase RimI-like enzyme